MILDDIWGFSPNCIQGAHGNPLSSFKLEVVASQGDATGLRDMKQAHCKIIQPRRDSMQKTNVKKARHKRKMIQPRHRQCNRVGSTWTEMKACGQGIQQNNHLGDTLALLSKSSKTRNIASDVPGIMRDSNEKGISRPTAEQSSGRQMKRNERRNGKGRRTLRVLHWWRSIFVYNHLM